MNENIDDILSEFKGKYHILEEQVDLDVQKAYFNLSRRMKGHVDLAVLERGEELWDVSVDIEEKKHLLVSLASLQDVKAYRILELFYKENKDKSIFDWAYLAFTESRMSIEGSLSDERQIFISTGLGGKEDMLRYFIVLFPHDNELGFTEFQQQFIKKEFQFVMDTNACEWEEQVVNTHYLSFLALIPMELELKDLILKIFDSTNQLDDFVNEKFIITNVKMMNEKEIFDFFENGDELEDIEEFDLE